jgi:hypothetical protein
MLVVALAGWQVKGLAGAVVSMAAMCASSSVLTFFASRFRYRFRDAPWRGTLQAGLLPVTAGLIMASAILLLRSSSTSWPIGLLTAAATALFVGTRLHPLIVLAAAAALGAAASWADIRLRESVARAARWSCIGTGASDIGGAPPRPCLARPGGSAPCADHLVQPRRIAGNHFIAYRDEMRAPGPASPCCGFFGIGVLGFGGCRTARGGRRYKPI